MRMFIASAVAAMTSAAMTPAAVLASESYNQNAVIVPNGVPTNDAQAADDKAAIDKGPPQAPLPDLPPDPPPPAFQDVTKLPPSPRS